MAKCEICNQNMSEAKGCKVAAYMLNNGEQVKPVKAGEEQWVEPGGKCGDCGAHYGHPHHPGCDVERCALCGGQFISCDCDWSNELLVKE